MPWIMEIKLLCLDALGNIDKKKNSYSFRLQITFYENN